MKAIEIINTIVKISATNLGIILSRKCNIRCAHCISLSSPHISDFPPIYNVIRILEDAAKLKKENIGPNLISFTGGEPFLYELPLFKYTTFASDLGFETGIVTNCFWATSISKAENKVKQFKHVTRFDISTDIRHSSYISLDRIKNAICAMTALNKLGYIRIVRQPNDEEYFKIFSEMISQLKVNHHLYESNLIYLNNKGEPILECESPVIKLPLFPCTSILPIIYPSGIVYACCGAIPNLKKNNPLILGDLKKESLRTVYRRFHTNPIIQSLRIGGIAETIDLIPTPEKEKVLLTHHDPSNMCYTCFTSLARLNTKVAENLKKNTASIAKYAMLRYVIYGESAGIDLMPRRCLNSIEQILKKVR
jgi:MoaA/NifB/PqqE/SkfB family radical SAM enzyme